MADLTFKIKTIAKYKTNNILFSYFLEILGINEKINKLFLQGHFLIEYLSWHSWNTVTSTHLQTAFEL